MGLLYFVIFVNHILREIELGIPTHLAGGSAGGEAYGKGEA